MSAGRSNTSIGVASWAGLPLVQDEQPVAQGHRLHLVVGDEQAGDPQPALQPADLGTHGEPQLGVEVGQRLVEQEQLRVPHDRAAHRDPLALSAGKLPRLALQQRADAEQPRRLVHPAADVRRG